MKIKHVGLFAAGLFCVVGAWAEVEFCIVFQPMINQHKVIVVREIPFLTEKKNKKELVCAFGMPNRLLQDLDRPQEDWNVITMSQITVACDQTFGDEYRIELDVSNIRLPQEFSTFITDKIIVESAINCLKAMQSQVPFNFRLLIKDTRNNKDKWAGIDGLYIQAPMK